MRKPRAIGLGAKLLDEESRAMLYEGCSISQLATLFDLDNRDVSRRIAHVAPCGERMTYPIYRVKDVAPYLIPPSRQDVTDAIKRMHPKDLPPTLTKEYWSAQSARLKFEEDNGDLWRTGDVIETLSEVFKTCAMTIKLMQDRVERATELSDRQRTILQQLTDGLLNDLADNLIKRFQHEQHRRNEHDWKDPSDEDEGEEI